MQLDTDPRRPTSLPPRTEIWHLPPRIPGPADVLGTLRPATSFEGRPEYVAWHDNRVYCLLEPEVIGGRSTYRVLSLAAVKTRTRLYEYSPGRPEVLASFVSDLPVAGFAAVEQGPALLTRQSTSSSNESNACALWVLFSGQWRRTSLPWELGYGNAPSSTEDIQLLDARDGLSVAVFRDGQRSLELWTGFTDPRRLGLSDPEMVTVRPLLEWSVQSIDLAGVAARSSDKPGVRLTFVQGSNPGDDALLAVTQLKDELRVVSLRASASLPLATLSGLPRGIQPIPQAAPAPSAVPTVAFAWTQPRTDDAGRTTSILNLREISALTGRDLFNGPVRDMGFMPSRRYQLMVLTLIFVMVSTLVFVIKGEPQIVPAPPAGKVYADLIRRAVATLLDYIPGALLIAILTGRVPTALLFPQDASSGSGSLDLAALGLAVGVAIVHCSICEALFGRSIGKFLTGCRVVSSMPAGGRPRIWQALLRNIVRWSVPLLTLFVIFDPARRHPGDLAARTIVVSDAEPEQPI